MKSVFARALIVIIGGSALMQKDRGGWRILKTRQAHWHVLRRCWLVIANMTLLLPSPPCPWRMPRRCSFVAPLFITLLYIPTLARKKVGVMQG